MSPSTHRPTPYAPTCEHRDDGWALFDLAQALDAQGRRDDAADEPALEPCFGARRHDQFRLDALHRLLDHGPHARLTQRSEPAGRRRSGRLRAPRLRAPPGIAI